MPWWRAPRGGHLGRGARAGRLSTALRGLLARCWCWGCGLGVVVLMVPVPMMEAQRAGLLRLGLIGPDDDKHAMGWAIGRLLDAAECLAAVGVALFPEGEC